MPGDFAGSTSRREFLTGQSGPAAGGVSVLAEVAPSEPVAGDTRRLSTRAMACQFAVVLNPGPADRLAAASRALQLVHRLEDQMSVFRPTSELSRLNARAAAAPVDVEPRLFELLRLARLIAVATGGAFDPTSGPLVSLWRNCRAECRIPTDAEITQMLERTGIEHIALDVSSRCVHFDRPGMELNLGGIGKGHALDRAGSLLDKRGVDDWLIHGGHSSVLARGNHNGQGGWPVGLRNPLFAAERLAIVLLKDGALSTSGSGVQSFRHAGKRYGHILDPRTGRPVEGMLSVTVLAPTAAEADALSTAFYVGGMELARSYCRSHAGVAALLIPPPGRGRTLELVNCGVPADVLWIKPEAR